MNNKYNLSKSSMDTLMDRLTAIATQSQNESVTGLMEAQLTSAFVERMTKVKGMDDVIQRNEQLSKTYVGFLNMYGFESMYDMYLYAKSCDQFPEELMKRKDYSKLVPVKRKITRNGKETEITVYEDPNKGGSESNEGNSAGRGTPSAGKVSHARELKGKVHGHEEKVNPQNIAKIKQAAEEMSGKGKKTDSDFYLELQGPEGETAGIVGYSEQGDYLVMDFYRTNQQVPGIAARGFAELVRIAMSKDKGVKVGDIPMARPVFIKFGLEQEGDHWAVTSEDLKEAMGESGNDSD